MAAIDHTQFLAQCPTFRDLHMAGLQAVLQVAHHRQVGRNAFFFHQGDPATAFYVLTEGEAKLTQVTPEGHQMLIRFAGLAGLIERYPRIALNMLEVVAGHYQRLLDRYQELATERVERRVARALLRLARQVGQKEEDGVLIGLPLSREDLAEMTGTTLYSVSRILSRWEHQGLVESGRERVLIHHPHALVAIAEDLPPDTSFEDF
jgi:CRP-like cAMP-binding protein